MGYRSDVRIITSKKGFEKLSDFVKKYLEKIDKDLNEHNLLKALDIETIGKGQCYFGWNYLKWYDGYPEVDAINEGLDYLGENEYSYRFMEIGEDYDDVEHKYNDGEKDKDIILEYPSMIREFDDDYIKDLITKEIKPMELFNDREDEIEYE